MGSAFHQLCPRYSGTLNPTAPTAIRLWETFTFKKLKGKNPSLAALVTEEQIVSFKSSLMIGRQVPSLSSDQSDFP